MTLKNVTLDDKYDLAQSRVFVTGYQALIRACLMQQERDRLAASIPPATCPATAARPWAGSTSSSCGPRPRSNAIMCCSSPG